MNLGADLKISFYFYITHLDFLFGMRTFFSNCFTKWVTRQSDIQLKHENFVVKEHEVGSVIGLKCLPVIITMKYILSKKGIFLSDQ